MDNTFDFGLRWGHGYEATQPDERPARPQQQDNDEAARQAKLERRQAAYKAKQKRKRSKDRYRTDPEFRQHCLQQGKERRQRKKAEALALKDDRP